jgi:hypothetical protein
VHREVRNAQGRSGMHRVDKVHAGAVRYAQVRSGMHRGGKVCTVYCMKAVWDAHGRSVGHAHELPGMHTGGQVWTEVVRYS